MKRTIPIIAVLLFSADVNADIIFREYPTKAKTIYLNDTQFIEITPKGERLYCEESQAGKTKCTKESDLKAIKETPEEQAIKLYDSCVYGQVTNWHLRFKTFQDAVIKAQKKCDKMLPPVVKCGADADCCEKNPLRCHAEEMILDAAEGAQR